MKKILVIIVLSMLSSLISKAQDTIKRKVQPDSIIKIAPYSSGRRAGYLYTVGGKIQSSADIRLKLLSYQPSAIEVKAAEKNMHWSFISLGGVGVAGIAALVEFKNNNKYIGQTTQIVDGQSQVVYQKHNQTAAYILTGVAGGFLIAEVATLINAGKHTKKSFKLYNQRFE
jgi:hypothetical protein